MVALISLTLPFLISAISAYSVPRDQADGFYRAYIDANGNQVHEQITADMLQPAPAGAKVVSFAQLINVGQTATPASIFPRDQYSYCGCGIGLDHGNCDNAVADLKHQVGNGVQIPPNYAYYSIRGSVVMFACNYDSGQYLDVDTPDVTRICGQITSQCGTYIAGTVGVPGLGGIGYMRSGGDFCAAAFNSNRHNC